MFTGVFGVGEATAKKWITNYKLTSIEDAIHHDVIAQTTDERLAHGVCSIIKYSDNMP